MANVEDQNTPISERGGVATTQRAPAEPKLKVRPRDGAEPVDSAEFARLFDLYDNSFRNIAEGEVVKGTVLKVTPSEVVIDVGRSEEHTSELQSLRHLVCRLLL